MAFRRSDDSGPTGSRWRLDHRALLAECGVPGDVADSDRRWVYVLLHGADPGTGWDATWISPQQAADLLAVLLPDLRSEVGFELVRALRRRVGE